MAEVEEFDLSGNSPFKKEEDRAEAQEGKRKESRKTKKEVGGEEQELRLLEKILDGQLEGKKSKAKDRAEAKVQVMSKEELEEHQAIIIKLHRFAEHPFFNDFLKQMKFDL